MKDVTCRGIEVYGYNIQGWQESIAADFYGYDVFSQTINYQIPFMETSKPRYDGMISEVRHRHLNKDIQTVNYKYDGLRRLVDSEHFVNWDSTACNLWTESSIVYDLNGNIENLSRTRESDDEDIIVVTHSGNRMTGSRINGGTTNTYSYYSDGNLKQDNRRNLQFVYNLLNLLAVVTDASGQTVKVRYSYLADGTKLSVRDAQNDGLSYRGSFVYTVDGASGSTGVTEKLESIAHDEGRFVALSTSVGATTTQFIDTWYIRDHLGSVRTVLDITRDTSEVSDPTLAILEQNDYLPFGTRIDLDSLAYDQSNRYRFNGKEEQVTGNIGLTDYGARFYDCILPRWTTPDPLAEKYYSTSPYAFCNNNPVNFVDPDGRSTWVVANPDGTYTIEGGNLDDNDLNIYVVTYDEDGNMNIGESIGRTTSITSFYNYDKGKDGKVKGWMKGSVIIPSDESGMRFISTMLQKDPSLLGYIWNARNNMPYDFKVTNCMGERIDGLDPYRGMPISKDADAVIYTSARDVGNIMAGYIAGRKGLAWHIARSGFDMYQSLSEPGMGWTPEGVSTQNAQRVGWKEGFMIYYKKRLSIND